MTADIGPWFIAQYNSECAECPRTIREGEQARYKNGEVVCEACGASARRQSDALCPICYLTLSVSEISCGKHRECE